MVEKFEFYDFNESLQRISTILDTSEHRGEPESKVLPEDVMKKCYWNKFYCTVLLIRIPPLLINSGDNIEMLKTKILSAYISEIAAILHGSSGCKDFFMAGDTIISIFDTPIKKDIESIVDAMSRIYTLRTIIEKKANIPAGSLNVKIVINFGECEAYYTGSYSNPQPSILWNGKVISSSLELLNKSIDSPSFMVATSTLYNNLHENYQKFFKQYILDNKIIYIAYMYNIQMDRWLDTH